MLRILGILGLVSLVGLISISPILGVVQRIRARAKLNDLRANLVKHLDDGKFSVDDLPDDSRFYLKGGPPAVGLKSIWKVWEPLDCRIEVYAGRNTNVMLYVSNPKTWLDSSPSVRIHHRVNEVDDALTCRRQALSDLVARILVDKLGFSVPEVSTEIYTRSEHEALKTLIRSPTRAEFDAGFMEAMYTDADGQEKVLRMFVDRTGGFRGDD
jgi:hypothetical protein